jgi:hypothetical protein
MGSAEKIWLFLVTLTATGAWLGETAQAGWPLTCVVAGLIFAKAHLVIDHYMEARAAHRNIRRILYTFVSLISALVLFSHA